MKRSQLAPRKVTELMLINLNEEAVNNYKSRKNIVNKYEGPTDLFKYEEGLSSDDEDWLP